MTAEATSPSAKVARLTLKKKRYYIIWHLQYLWHYQNNLCNSFYRIYKKYVHIIFRNNSKYAKRQTGGDVIC